MTDEKRKPEKDEVKDEQLEDVAGGGVDKTVMSSLRGDGLPDGIDSSNIPNTCLTPQPQAPPPAVQDPSEGGIESGGGATKVGKTLGG